MRYITFKIILHKQTKKIGLKARSFLGVEENEKFLVRRKNNKRTVFRKIELHFFKFES